MPIQFTCPYCFKKTLVDDKYSGQEGPCAGCGKSVTIPALRSRGQSVEGQTSSDETQAYISSSSYVPLAGSKTRRKQFGKLVAALCAALGLVAIGYVAWIAATKFGTSSFVQQISQRRDRAQCMNNLRQITRALDRYADQHGSYPPAFTRDADGKPLHSWRTLILEELGEPYLHSQVRFDEPWDSEHNVAVLGHACPDPYKSPARDDYEYTIHTSYFLILGDGTIYPSDGLPIARDQISDGLARTLLIVEADNQTYPWYQPIDIEARDWSGSTGSVSIGGTHVGGFTAAFADGQPAWIPDNTPKEIIRNMITAQGDEHVDRQPYVNP